MMELKNAEIKFLSILSQKVSDETAAAHKNTQNLEMAADEAASPNRYSGDFFDLAVMKTDLHKIFDREHDGGWECSLVRGLLNPDSWPNGTDAHPNCTLCADCCLLNCRITAVSDISQLGNRHAERSE